MAPAITGGAVPAYPPGYRAAPSLPHRHHRVPEAVYTGPGATTAAWAGE
ncbi:hypothetical protein [Streptomyces humi]